MKAAKMGRPEDHHETNGNAELPDKKNQFNCKRQFQGAGRGARHTVVNASGFTSQMRPAKRALQDDTNSWNPIPDALSLAAQAIR